MRIDNDGVRHSPLDRIVKPSDLTIQNRNYKTVHPETLYEIQNTERERGRLVLIFCVVERGQVVTNVHFPSSAVNFISELAELSSQS